MCKYIFAWIYFVQGTSQIFELNSWAFIEIVFTYSLCASKSKLFLCQATNAGIFQGWIIVQTIFITNLKVRQATFCR